MDMDEEEWQICRLCGQNVNIFVDVFGEEGAKRFLDLKIQEKINILIDERDPLPKAVCIQCLGKLEFVCDFQEECLRTQQLLRDQYSLPPLSDVEEPKTDQSSPSTSNAVNPADNENVECNVASNSNNNNNNNNNNNSDKNLNQPESESSKEVTPKVKSSTRAQRSLPSQRTQTRNSNQLEKDRLSSETQTESNIRKTPALRSTRLLRSRQSLTVQAEERSETKSETRSVKRKTVPIANRLRSHNVNANGTNNHRQKENENTIQIPTNTLNKVLTAISNSPGIGVSVKESSNRTNDAEDISFTVELSKKQDAESWTVLAKVFPDQGSCLVDKTIVSFLEDKNNREVNNIVKNIVSSSNSNDDQTSLIDKLQNDDDYANSSLNPEELFKMDGKEIQVDDNLQQLSINNQVTYACRLCNKIYERKDKCTVHVKTHLGIKQFVCIVCQAKFVCKSDVMKHIRCSHTNPRPILCPKCPKRFRSKFDLTEHTNVHKGIRPYRCSDCGQCYHHKVSLQMHKKSHMPPQNLACEYCGKVFPYRTRLLSHIGSVHMKDRRNFRCRFCYNLYSSLSVLNEHIKMRHATTYTCETCSKTFKVASKYKAHVLQHSNPKPFMCNICNNRYASKAFLNEHVLKHQGLRKHVCQECGAKFAQASHLAAHRYVHGEKTHACPDCGKKFNRRDNMKVHQRRHVNVGSKKNDFQAENSN